MKMNPNRAKNANVTATLPAVKRRLRKTRTSSIGCDERSSQRTNPVSSAPAAANALRLSADVHPLMGASMTAHTNSVTPAIDSSRPTGSNRLVCGSREVGTTSATATIATSTTGTFTRNTEPHE